MLLISIIIDLFVPKREIERALPFQEFQMAGCLFLEEMDILKVAHVYTAVLIENISILLLEMVYDS